MTQKISTAKAGAEKTALHYRLTNEEWLKTCHDLKPAEQALLYHLRTLNPFGDRTLELTITGLGEALEVHKSTISRALKVLDSKGYIDLELSSVRVRLRTRPAAVTLLSPSNSIVQRRQESSLDNQIDQEATDDAPAQQMKSSGNKHSLQPLSTATSESSHTIHTDHTDHTLSMHEREKTKELLSENGDPLPEYRNWLIRKSQELPTKPTLLEQWVKVQAVVEANQKDFLKHKNFRDEIDPLRFSFDEGRNYRATSSDIVHNHILLCKQAMEEGDLQRAVTVLQNLWKDERRNECSQICNYFPEWGIELGPQGPKKLDD